MRKNVYFVPEDDSEYQMLSRTDWLEEVFKVQIVLCIVPFIGKVLVKRNVKMGDLSFENFRMDLMNFLLLHPPCLAIM